MLKEKKNRLFSFLGYHLSEILETKFSKKIENIDKSKLLFETLTKNVLQGNATDLSANLVVNPDNSHLSLINE